VNFAKFLVGNVIATILKEKLN